MNIIGLCGLAGSGKDSAADFLVSHHGFVKVALADPIKRACAEWFGWDEETLWGPSEKRNVADPMRAGGRSPRYVLQRLGTEFGRHCYEDIWVSYALRIAREVLDMHQHYVPSVGLAGRASLYEGVVIPDVRFLNEVEAIRNAGGVVWKIERHGAGLQGAAAQHVSETEQTSIPAEAFARIVVNDGTLGELREKVRP